MRTKSEVFKVKTQAERHQEFLDNLTVRETDYGLYIETYARIPHGSCHYAQAYDRHNIKSVTYVKNIAEAKQRFVNSYWPMNQVDNESEG